MHAVGHGHGGRVGEIHKGDHFAGALRLYGACGVGHHVGYVCAGAYIKVGVYVEPLHAAFDIGVDVYQCLAVDIGAFGGAVVVYQHHVVGLEFEIYKRRGEFLDVYAAVDTQGVLVYAGYGEIVEAHHVVLHGYFCFAELVLHACHGQLYGCGVEIKGAVHYRVVGIAFYVHVAVEHATQCGYVSGQERIDGCEREAYHGEVEIVWRAGCHVVEVAGQSHGLDSVDAYIGVGV